MQATIIESEGSATMSLVFSMVTLVGLIVAFTQKEGTGQFDSQQLSRVDHIQRRKQTYRV